MHDVRLTRDLAAELHHPGEIARMAGRGEIVRLRRGAWTTQASNDATTRHRQLIQGTVGQISADAVLSHVSAALLHGLPIMTKRLDQVHWTRSRRSGGRARSQVHVYAAPLAADEIVSIDGLAVTSLERTIVDLSRHLPYPEAVMAADAALHTGLRRELLSYSMETARHRPGSAGARRVVAFANGLSESPGESWSRVVFAQIGMPPSHLQYEVVGEDGVLIGRSDFCWEEERVLGEFDGLVKYERLLRPGETATDVVVREKVREDRLREQEWEMLRWTWQEIRPDLLRERLTRAVGRAARLRASTAA